MSSNKTRKFLELQISELSCLLVYLQDSSNSEVELKVSLPDRNICVVTIRRNDNTNTVYNVSRKLPLLLSVRKWIHFKG